ncbi:hypothetical protein IHQ71_09260 [Rhizobium sp. TH2]|uniref:hypothetical protein n=1 Tax=Rhizobium sp. TH2 TaxID=2775403 RepID=UPI0021572A3B|nr:hypothetical protein [Rhizobium sp. TH2]UVC10745.1 hypothetical protein IHQ71_09260 [Rhizobium sp. TH2]
MKRLVLHIGVENTASTYLQQTFANSRDALRSAGVLYPHAPGETNHIKLAAFAMDDARGDEIRIMAGIRSPGDAAGLKADFLGELAREVSECGCDAILLSNEHCSSRLIHENDVRRLRDLLAPLAETITIVVYLRRQDEAMLSMHSTAVRSGSAQPLGFPSEHVIAARFDYEKLLQRWAIVFGKENIVARLFNHLHNSNILDDFAAAAALPADIGWSEPEEPLNTRLDARQAEYLRILNAFLPNVGDKNHLARRGNLSDVVSKVKDPGPPLGLPPDMAKEILERMRASNGAVAREYFGRELPGDPLFGEVHIPQAAEPYEMTLEEFAKTTAEIWALKHKQSRYLLHRLKEALKAQDES